MNIRIAQAGDESSIAQVIVQTWKAAYRGIVSDSFLDTMTTEKHEVLFRDHISQQSETILVLENEVGKIVGMVSGGRDRSGSCDCELVAIYILPGYQKKGYGSGLFRGLVEKHKKNQYRSMLIWTFQDNRDRGFYETLGGVVREEKTISFDGPDIPIVCYMWQDITALPGKSERG